MGETNEPKKAALTQASEVVMVAQTMGGRMLGRVLSSATPHGLLVFFADFLGTGGAFDRWVQGCRRSYTSPTASAKRDVLGTADAGNSPCKLRRKRFLWQ